jgi:hypothetical protein
MSIERKNTQRTGTGPGSVRSWVVSMLGAMAIAGSGAALAATGDSLLITYQTNGIGVAGSSTSGAQVPEQINNDRAGPTEALAVDFGAEAKLAKVYISNLFSSENGAKERGQWEAFDALGQPVGDKEFFFTTGTEGLIDDIGPENGSTSGPFRYLVFTALPYLGTSTSTTDSSDYFVRSITYTLNATDATPVLVAGSSESFWQSLTPTGFALGSAYTNEDGSFIDADVTEIDISETTCSGPDGGNNIDGCTIEFAEDFKVFVADSSDVNGSATAVVTTIADPRQSCGCIGENCTTDTTLDLGFILSKNPLPLLTGPDIPAHLCGIPNPVTGLPEFKLVNINSKLEVIRSVLELTAQNPANTDYYCQLETPNGIVEQTDPSKRPVIGWLPKTSNPDDFPEVPVNDAFGREDKLQDVTFACGSTRGGSSRFSFLVYNLRHVVEKPADYVGIIGSAIEQLNYTVADTDLCVSKVENKAVLSRAKSATSAFSTGRYSTAKRQYINLLETVSNDVHYDQCYYDLENNVVTISTETLAKELGYLPRNFRGDLIVQIRHILYMIDKFLGEKKPALPEF